MRRYTGTAVQLSPIARRQRQLAGFGLLGAANYSVWSGPPVGEGAGKGAETGAAQGASLGTTIMPGIGTAIGAVVGAIGGAIAGSINKVDPEQHNFDSAVALWQANRLAVLQIGNKYLPLAGLFDLNLKGPHIPIYQKYGRMGEEKFVYDLATLIYNAAQAGKITASDTPQTVMAKVVQPWIDSWGFGPMQDPHADMINLLILGMVMDYVTGAGPAVWRSRSGPLPASFSQIPPFQLPSAAPAATSAAVPQTATAQTAAPSSTSVSVPSGFTLIGTANNLQAYLGPDGLYYSWSGTAMSPLTGVLAGLSGGVITVINGQQQIPNAGSASTATPQSYASTTPAPVYTPPPDTSSYTPPAQQAGPMQPAVIAATPAGIPTWAWLGLGAGAVYLLMGRRRPA